jgi:lipid-A-disaccharide synthase
MVPSRIMILAGEPSGDQIAARVLEELKLIHPNIDAFGMGGPALKAAGMQVDLSMEGMGVMGLLDALSHIGEAFRRIKTVQALVERKKPDLILFVDFPGFNLPLACRLLKAANSAYRFYYISPKYWAWKSGRLKKLTRCSDSQALIFPFEEPDFKALHADAHFVGHPVLDLIEDAPTRAEARSSLSIDEQEVLGIFPGSRQGEWKRHFPILREALKQIDLDQLHVLMQVPTHTPTSIIAELRQSFPKVQVVVGQMHAAMLASDFAFVASGTASLEAAALGCPHLVFYRLDPVAAWLSQFFVHIPYASPANLAVGEGILDEVLNRDATPGALVDWVKKHSGQREKLRSEGRILKERVHQALGGAGASKRTAKWIHEILEKRHG